uniref:WGS project CAEQ00000000 data, annotated contig 2426 n=1 Tax=Trypanosoma congolense (strain IL3000) TaxID=1068625 RepID=F9WE16_TRYCI|nr:unnamed protein product [Trypanosoma congolense IL3000]
MLRHMLAAPRISLTNLALVRYRCSAITLKSLAEGDEKSGKITADGGASTPVTHSDAVGHAPSLEDPLHGGKLLLPRGTPPSFVRDRMLPPMIRWLHSIASSPLGSLSSDMNEDTLRVLFSLPKKRKRVEGVACEEKDWNDAGTTNDHPDFVPAVGLLLALFGYRLNDGCRFEGDDADTRNAGGTASVDGLHGAFCCHFCGGKPHTIIKGRQESSGEGVGMEVSKATVSDATAEGTTEERAQGGNSVSPNIETTGVTAVTVVNEHCTISVTEQVGCSGHHESCPWKVSFLSLVLADASAKLNSVDVTFTVTGMNPSCTGALCFKLHEVVKLMECWRLSGYTEFKLKELYMKSPLPAAVRSVVPRPAEEGVEKFLRQLQGRHSQSGETALKGTGKNGAEVKTAQQCHLVPLFTGSTPWNSYFRVASIVNNVVIGYKIQAVQTENVVAKEQSNIAGDGNSSRPQATANRNREWKAVYDSGRRCILAAYKCKDASATGATAPEKLVKFLESYEQRRQRDAEALSVQRHTESLSGVMDRLWGFLGDEALLNTLRHEAHGPEAKYAPQLSDSDRERASSMLDAFDRSVQGASEERQPQGLGHAGRPQQQLPNNKGNTSPGSAGSLEQHQAVQTKQQQNMKFQRQEHGPMSHQNMVPQQQQHQQTWKQRQKQKKKTNSSSSTPQQQQQLVEGILPLPVSGGAVLSGTGPPVLQPQQAQASFGAAQHGFGFSGRGRGSVVVGESVGVLNDAYGSRPSIMGSRSVLFGNFSGEWQVGGRGGGQAEAHRRGKGGGRGSGRGGGGVGFR